MSLKRILNELHNIIPNKLLENNLFDKFYFVEIGNDIICRDIGVINKYNEKLELRFKISDSYPFKPPLVTVCNSMEDTCYLRWLSKLVNYGNNISCLDQKNFNAWIFSVIHRPHLKHYFNFPNKGICYCCESITCSNKWFPSHLLSNILFEYIMAKQFFIYSSDLNQQQINNIFKNENWILPNDVILHIINFL